ncbi:MULTISPECIES: hypothetical protein [unclassified Agarivorans]|uniref:hypothetical protein n=1 Tax=unclassified Agarivorans TaxID=2636026 RepID=UPI003D7ED04B
MSIDSSINTPDDYKFQCSTSNELAEALFSLHSLPSQANIDELAQLSLQVKQLSPVKQLKRLHHAAEQQQLFKCFTASPWFFQEGADYLYRPELLLNAPLTQVILLLKETLGHRHWHNLLQMAHPHYVPQLLARLRQFATDCSRD